MNVVLTVVAGVALGLLGLFWTALVLVVPLYGRGFRLSRPTEAPRAAPDLSICIPARDEAANIGACVQAALRTRWPGRLEVLVVDDRSSDGTGELARAAGAGDPRLQVIRGDGPPPGWAGKPAACERAARAATGELLLFLDADVVVDPDAALALAGALEGGAALVSAFGSWELVSFWERALIPAVGWFIRGSVNLAAIEDPARPEAFANGQCILVRRAAYDAIGGHGAVRDSVLDDVRLAEAMKRGGHRLAMRVAPWLFRVRLYRSLQEIVAGYTKNLYEGMGRRAALGWSAVIFIVLGTLLPAGLALGCVLGTALGRGPAWPWTLGWCGVLALQVLYRARVERLDGRSGAIAWTHPLANGVLVWILARSILGARATWKGRAFETGRSA